MSDSLAGKFLVAGKHLRDPNFYKSVVLMVEHGPQGAMGLVVNRPTPVPLAEALADHFDVGERDDLVYYGGPVEPSALFVVHNSDAHHGDEHAVVPGVYVGSSAEVFERVVEAATAGGADLSFRVFSGCAGWGPGQLEGELARGDWYLVPASSEETFLADPYELWESARSRASEPFGSLPEPTDHPDWN